MENRVTAQRDAPFFGHQLSNNDQLICPITYNSIPLEKRAIVIECGSGGKPSATIYDQRALFKWLDINHTDPCTKKPVQCVVNSQGSIIYPVEIQSDFPTSNSRPVGSSQISHRIYTPSEVTMSQKEKEERKNYRKIKHKILLKKLENPFRL